MPKRWIHRPPGSNWGDFGPDDQRGRLNLITPACVLAAVKEVTEGRTFCLSLPLDYPGGDYHALNRAPPDIRAIHRNCCYAYNLRPRSDQTDVWCDDLVTLATQGSTQWDALAHVGTVFDADGDGVPEIRFYNGYRGGTDIPFPAKEGPAAGRVGARALGIENMAESCVQGRGVMIDLFSRFGRRPEKVGYDALMRICEEDKIVIESGDMVCLHTGLANALLAMKKMPDTETLEMSHAALDSRDERLLRWIDESGMSVLIADNFAVEAVPARAVENAIVAEPLHELCIVKLGIHIGELWHLTPLNDWLKSRGRSRFLLTAPPLRLPGAVGSPVTPVATV